MSEFVQSASFYVEGKEIEIFKSNALVEGAFDLSPAEHDLMTLAINKLFSQGIGGKRQKSLLLPIKLMRTMPMKF